MIKRLIKALFNKAGYNIVGTKYVLKQFKQPNNLLQLDFDHAISKYLIDKNGGDSNFNFLQIGAFDGVECDPLFKYLQRFNWKGIMLEPQPVPFAKLKDRYKGRTGIILKNAAISNKNGKASLYTLEGRELPEWAKGMASFNKQNILKHKYLFPKIHELITETEVETITFQKLFEDQSIDSLDLLQIDTEGFDAEILEMFPFDRIKPKIIHFESKHIPKPKLEMILDELIANGYKIARDREEDMMAVFEENK